MGWVHPPCCWSPPGLVWDVSFEVFRALGLAEHRRIDLLPPSTSFGPTSECDHSCESFCIRCSARVESVPFRDGAQTQENERAMCAVPGFTGMPSKLDSTNRTRFDPRGQAPQPFDGPRHRSGMETPTAARTRRAGTTSGNTPLVRRRASLGLGEATISASAASFSLVPAVPVRAQPVIRERSASSARKRWWQLDPRRRAAHPKQTTPSLGFGPFGGIATWVVASVCLTVADPSSEFLTLSTV